MDVSLVLFKKGGERKTFVLPGQHVLIGRARECDFWIPVMSVSRRHCEITVDERTVHLHDLGSRNGTFVNGTRVQNAILRPGDFLRVGPIVFGVQIDGTPENLIPPDFVQLEEEHAVDKTGDGSTIVQPPQPGQTQAPPHDIVEDVMSWLEDKNKKAGERGS
jgi:pSer/pThr/pTyr-binding forkhead associated (FHA) protein